MDQEFTVTSEVRDGCLILTTSGYVNNLGGEAIAKEFNQFYPAGGKHVIVNLGGSKSVNSVGMSFLIEIIEELAASDGKMVFTNLDPAVEKMLAIMGLFEFAGKASSVDEAMVTFFPKS